MGGVLFLSSGRVGAYQKNPGKKAQSAGWPQHSSVCVWCLDSKTVIRWPTSQAWGRLGSSGPRALSSPARSSLCGLPWMLSALKSPSSPHRSTLSSQMWWGRRTLGLLLVPVLGSASSRAESAVAESAEWQEGSPSCLAWSPEGAVRCQHLGQVWDPWQDISCVTLNMLLLDLDFPPGQWELWTGATQPRAAVGGGEAVRIYPMARVSRNLDSEPLPKLR